MANINKSKFSSIDCTLPSNFILETFNEMVESSFKQIMNFSEQNQKLVEARDLLLPRLMNGEIAV